MKIIITLSILYFMLPTSIWAQTTITSPNGKIVVDIEVKNQLSYQVSSAGKTLIQKVELDLLFDGKTKLSLKKPKISKVSLIENEITAVIPFKSKIIADNYREVILKYGKVNVEFRVYNDGVAYRYVSHEKGNIEVNERMDVTFNESVKMWSSPIKGYECSFEVPYQKVAIDTFSTDVNTYLPLLVGNNDGYKILFTESNIEDYPHLYFKKGDGNSLLSTFPNYPTKVEKIGDRQSKILERGEFIAKTNADRSFPWRVMILAEEDKDLVASTLVYNLAAESQIDDTSWIKPGRVAWEWWNASNLYNVDFEAGFNTETYKYYIDFAHKYGLEYIILDEGWSISTKDLSLPNPELDLKELIRYGNDKNVGIILWATWSTLDEQWFVLDKFQEWGIKGIKVDFMDRADQLMVNYYEKVAKLSAERKLLVDFHGSYKPVGLYRKYPNVISYEGVHGLENSKWSDTVTPEHDVTLPFIRMVCGPMDYTPGAMRNYNQSNFQANWTRPGSQGTRCHQLAMFVVYESGIQMLCDSPSNYEREEESTAFLAQIPVTWDETRVLEAKVGEYIVIARRNGDTWYIGGMSNNERHEFDLDLSFLKKATYQMTSMEDGLNAKHFAEDYSQKKTTLENKKLKIKMAAGGGFVAILK